MSSKKRAVIECRNYYLPAGFPLLTLQGDNWRISDLRSNRLHFHNCLEIGYCHSDSGYMEFFGETTRFEAGDLTVVPRNVPHTTYSTEGTRSRWSYLFFDPQGLLADFLPPTWKNYDLLTHDFTNYRYIFKQADFPAMHQLLEILFTEVNKQHSDYQQSVRGLLLSLYIQIYREQERQVVVRESNDSFQSSLALKTLEIAPALEFIESNYMKQFSVNDLADICCWSPTHFRRVFMNIMGQSPLDYVNSTRVMKSCYLLNNTEESILSISEQVGFQSVSSFNRNFKRVLERAPSEYRQEVLRFANMDTNPKIQEYTGWMAPE